MIKQADANDISAIEDILLDAVIWMKKSGLENQWTESSIKWECLSKDYKISDFYIDYINGMPAGCMAVTDIDEKYWPEVLKGKSFYLHKLAVKREFSGKGVSKELISFLKTLALKKDINSLRLDCNYYRDKLRLLYENSGFKYVGDKNIHDNHMALYVCEI